MNALIKNMFKSTKPARYVYLEPVLSEQGRRLREVSGVWNILRLGFLQRLIEVRFYKGGQPVLHLCPAWVEPELLRQLLVWCEKGREPGLIVKNFSDSIDAIEPVIDLNNTMETQNPSATLGGST